MAHPREWPGARGRGWGGGALSEPSSGRARREREGGGGSGRRERRAERSAAAAAAAAGARAGGRGAQRRRRRQGRRAGPGRARSRGGGSGSGSGGGGSGGGGGIVARERAQGSPASECGLAAGEETEPARHGSYCNTPDPSDVTRCGGELSRPCRCQPQGSTWTPLNGDSWVKSPEAFWPLDFTPLLGTLLRALQCCCQPTSAITSSWDSELAASSYYPLVRVY
ncbi:alanine and glycine-rich protein-like [Meriones unguiculatus]|uniref:alanine and glycine-rich protein-like n=1 Tax=Meriones unguiculatus TaxID=10047 RepID=UPI00293EAD85|nr:alanine and glycine-rich protein-like [Meriones unguiculatus]